MPIVINYKKAKEFFLLEIGEYLTVCNNKFFKKAGLARAEALQAYLNNSQNNQNIHVLVALIALFGTSSQELAGRLVKKLITENAKGKCESPIFEQESLEHMIKASSGGDRRLSMGGIEDKIHIAYNLLLIAGVKCGLTFNVPEQEIDVTKQDVIDERDEAYKITETGAAISVARDLIFDTALTALIESMRPVSTSKCVML